MIRRGLLQSRTHPGFPTGNKVPIEAASLFTGPVINGVAIDIDHFVHRRIDAEINRVIRVLFRIEIFIQIFAFDFSSDAH